MNHHEKIFDAKQAALLVGGQELNFYIVFFVVKTKLSFLLRFHK